MRGRVNPQASLFAYVDLESMVPASHPLRRIKALSDASL
ncbi:MAG TPA: IS5/IS1182 family transposase, partial [Fibrobacteria bacterium]|nr:IS5/IS1182 family transposase [Fibrobacteria bacterium]